MKYQIHAFIVNMLKTGQFSLGVKPKYPCQIRDPGTGTAEKYKQKYGL